MKSLFFVLAVGASGAKTLLQTLSRAKTGAPIPVGNVVYLSGTPVDHGLDECQPFPNLGKESKPEIVVKGTHVRVEAFLYADCQNPVNVPAAVPFYLGTCDTREAPETKVGVTPKSEEAPAGLTHYRSYRVVMCDN